MISVLITTFNRRALVARAIDSVLDQGHPDAEILVVDDASRDGTEAFVRERFPQVRYLRQPANSGPGPARNRGISVATHPWVLVLDDDDTLMDGALATVAGAIAELSEATRYPVVQFACTNGRPPAPFAVVTLDDYLRGTIAGDFTPVIQRDVFLRKSLEYPALRVGGEHLLWWRIARDFGIPTWEKGAVRVHADAPVRITSAQNQIARAADHARLQELTLQHFGDVLWRDYAPLAHQKQIGAATYHLLARRPSRAREILAESLGRCPSARALGLYVASFLPSPLAALLFRGYRRIGAFVAASRARRSGCAGVET
jgi:GalNAc5-diNAcBac-PP-undecaprenol beta-1,3-glucosyltransferase